MYSKENLIKRGNELAISINNENKKILLGKNKFKNLGTTLLGKAKELNLNYDKAISNPNGALLYRDTNKELDNLTLLERGEKAGAEYQRLRNAPKIVDTNISGPIGLDTRESQENYDKFDKILYYAQKYKIPFASLGVKKMYIELAAEIRKYEAKHLKEIMKKGIDKKYGEFGLYIKKY